MDIVEKVINQTKSGLKSIQVDKLAPPYIDVGTLLLIDEDPLDNSLMKSARNDYLLSVTRDNVQLLFNKVWELPARKMDESIVVDLPEPQFVLPRAQPAPKPKPLTKWQEFAQQKGIQKKKKDKATWDDELKKWVPLYGYKKAAAEKDKDWVIEVPQNVDPMTDMFAAKAEAKSEKVAKNELQRLRNIARSQNVKLPRTGLPITSDKATSSQLATALTVARSSTASAGKFQAKLPKEKDARGKGVTDLLAGAGKKRKATPPDLQTEKANNLSIIDSVLKKQPKLDMNAAANRQIDEEQKQRSAEKNDRPKSQKGLKGSKKFKSKHSKPTGNKGQRNPSKKTAGRKRR